MSRTPPHVEVRGISGFRAPFCIVLYGGCGEVKVLHRGPQDWSTFGRPRQAPFFIVLYEGNGKCGTRPRSERPVLARNRRSPPDRYLSVSSHHFQCGRPRRSFHSFCAACVHLRSLKGGSLESPASVFACGLWTSESVELAYIPFGSNEWSVRERDCRLL